MRVLILCPVAASTDAAATAAALWPSAARGGTLDLLAYGRGSKDLPPSPGARPIALPSLSGRSIEIFVGWSRFMWQLRRSRYRVAALIQPGLGASRARGLLLCFPHLIGAGKVVVVDPPSGTLVREVSASLALVDLLRWIAIQLASAGIARAACAALRRLGPRPGAERPIPRAGPVIYLRTDHELATVRLGAGGSLAHTDGIVRAMKSRGHSVEVWCTGELAGLPADVPVHSVPVLRRGNVPTEIAELLSSVAQTLTLRRRASTPVIVYQRYSLNNLTGLLLARRWDVPLVLEANASEASWRREWSALRYPRLADVTERLLLASADRVTAVSDNVARELLDAGVHRRRLRVVPNGVDVARFAHVAPQPLPLEPGFVVCFVGLFYPWHGTLHLAKAFVRLAARCPEARLLLVGDGEEAPRVRAVLRDGGVLGVTHMPGIVEREQVPRYLAAADVLVSPHVAGDGFIGSPIKLFEYMAAGRAIVASRIAQIGQVLRHEDTALLVTPGNSDALADALVRLHDDPMLRDRLAKAAWIHARRRYTWDARLRSALGGDETL
jgi:glycosyltransferase involved in cell wall biosynthesis